MNPRSYKAALRVGHVRETIFPIPLVASLLLVPLAPDYLSEFVFLSILRPQADYLEMDEIVPKSTVVVPLYIYPLTAETWGPLYAA